MTDAASGTVNDAVAVHDLAEKGVHCRTSSKGGRILNDMIGAGVGEENAGIEQGTTGAPIIGNAFGGRSPPGLHFDASWAATADTAGIKADEVLFENRPSVRTTNDGCEPRTQVRRAGLPLWRGRANCCHGSSRRPQVHEGTEVDDERDDARARLTLPEGGEEGLADLAPGLLQPPDTAGQEHAGRPAPGHHPAAHHRSPRMTKARPPKGAGLASSATSTG
ncbi:hypothetical protein ACH4VR_18315 [Streptomyces sp. NPDC020883]|uniref:hypothetical protein n=1 Tax=Streptomyces sp. NPDC020883 TaxID=3365099 RepID=UPI0037AFF403